MIIFNLIGFRLKTNTCGCGRLNTSRLKTEVNEHRKENSPLPSYLVFLENVWKADAFQLVDLRNVVSVLKSHFDGAVMNPGLYFRRGCRLRMHTMGFGGNAAIFKPITSCICVPYNKLLCRNCICFIGGFQEINIELITWAVYTKQYYSLSFIYYILTSVYVYPVLYPLI